MSLNGFAVAAIVSALLALGLAIFFARQVLAAPRGNERMVEISDAIREGAMAFLRREYTWVAGFVVIMAGLIFALLDWGRPWGALAYIFGAVLSATAGFVGMNIATAANARTTEAARQAVLSNRCRWRFAAEPSWASLSPGSASPESASATSCSGCGSARRNRGRLVRLRGGVNG